MLVWFEFAFGRVRNAAELACFSELKLLGSYPGYAEDSVSREHAAQKISHEFLAAAAGKRILFETALEGSSVSPEIREALEWAFRMNGTRFFRLRLGMSQEISSEETLLAAVQKFGDSGIMPVAQPGNLSPAEAELLKNDLRTLLESYDTVLINREDEAPSGADLLFRQTMEICDCALLYFGAGTTPRKLLRLAVKLQEKTGCATLAIMTGEKNRNTGEY